MVPAIHIANLQQLKIDRFEKGAEIPAASEGWYASALHLELTQKMPL